MLDIPSFKNPFDFSSAPTYAETLAPAFTSAQAFSGGISKQITEGSKAFQRNEQERGLGQPIYVLSDGEGGSDLPSLSQNVSANITQGTSKILLVVGIFLLALIALKLYSKP